MDNRPRLNFYEVCARYDRSVSTLYAWLGKGWMPKPQRLGGRCFWFLDDLEQWESDGFPRPCDSAEAEKEQAK